MAISVGGYLRLHGVIDASVDVLLTDTAEDAVVNTCKTMSEHAGQRISMPARTAINSAGPGIG
jgi:hypothetical protein